MRIRPAGALRALDLSPLPRPGEHREDLKHSRAMQGLGDNGVHHCLGRAGNSVDPLRRKARNRDVGNAFQICS
ncbi:hypothetical protein [Nocardia suismassiliense]|uniref:hypothetical protein n=1 Tax=Nocardia suismassiliense TaxID=2077092 RepID=UPI00131F18E1|nr:hypothetical protein [Nocardia suismassiliense]